MDLIAEIYDAVSDDQAFAALPARFAAEADARSAIFQVVSREWELLNASISYFTADMLDRYVALELFRLDPWRPPASRRENLNQLRALDEEVPVSSVVGSTFYNETFRRWGDDTARCLGGVFEVGDGYASIGLHRAAAANPFSPEEVARVGRVVPHFRRLYELRQQLGAAKARGALSEAALDEQANAVLVVDRHGRPQLMNRSAEALVGRGDPFVLGPAGLRLSWSIDGPVLMDAISSACARRGAQGGAFALARRSGRPLRVLVSPLATGHRTLALVVVNDPDADPPGRVEDLVACYGLTPAESQTAMFLAKGLSPSQTAARRGVSMATVRSQIQQVLRKTGARGVPELVALVVSLPRRQGA